MKSLYKAGLRGRITALRHKKYNINKTIMFYEDRIHRGGLDLRVRQTMYEQMYSGCYALEFLNGRLIAIQSVLNTKLTRKEIMALKHKRAMEKRGIENKNTREGYINELNNILEEIKNIS